jgi:hypothetical protein
MSNYVYVLIDTQENEIIGIYSDILSAKKVAIKKINHWWNGSQEYAELYSEALKEIDETMSTDFGFYAEEIIHCERYQINKTY